MISSATSDLLDRLLLTAGGPVQQLRQVRGKVVSATQGSYEALFDADLPGNLSLEERLLVAWYACRLTPHAPLAAHYREPLHLLATDPQTLAAVEQDALTELQSPRLQAVLGFTRTLVRNPVEGDREALNALLAAGLETIDVVTLGQLIAFISYQVRLAAGLSALQALEPAQ